jgi:hypothetical protein
MGLREFMFSYEVKLVKKSNNLFNQYFQCIGTKFCAKLALWIAYNEVLIGTSYIRLNLK